MLDGGKWLFSIALILWKKDSGRLKILIAVTLVLVRMDRFC